MRILTLIENTSSTDKLFSEHGLCFYIEHMGKKVLMDTGASEKFAENAQRMLINLSELNAAVISHNHIDHIGGLEILLGKKTNLKVYAKNELRGEFFKKIGIFKVPIGINKSILDKYNQNFVYFKKFQKIAEGMFLLSNEVYDENFSNGDTSLLMKKENKYVPDDFKHEIFMVVFPTARQEDGCVIISSCSHNGIINIVKTVRRNWQDVRIIALIGGFHFSGNGGKNLLLSDEYIESVCHELMRLDVEQIFTCHCTGEKGYEKMKNHLGDSIQYLQTGEELDF